VCEFHYLHHDTDGRPYADPLAMAGALADAAAATGIGLTLLPVVYERAGFAAEGLRPDQRRFACTATQALEMAAAVRAARRPGVTAGVALHSLRAARPASIRQVAAQAGDVPVHIHVAEQTAEVDDCLQHTGRRPVQWLADEGLLDARWQLVHATHTTPTEIEAVARHGAGVVLCPGTEANLGDGLPDLPGWLAAAVPWTVGTDSHVTRTVPDELRLLEYGQRLALRRRNVAADPAGGQPATAARLFDGAARGSAAAAGLPGLGRLAVGARADLLVVNVDDPALHGIPADHTLDALVFASPTRPFGGVMAGGRWVTQPPAAPG
jgi:formimidoylglutamate deiminase